MHNHCKLSWDTHFMRNLSTVAILYIRRLSLSYLKVNRSMVLLLAVFHLWDSIDSSLIEGAEKQL